MKIGIDSYCYHRFFGEIYASLETGLATGLTKGNLSTRQSSPTAFWLGGIRMGGSLHDAQHD